MTTFAGIVGFDGMAPAAPAEQSLAGALSRGRGAQIDMHRADAALFVQRRPSPAHRVSASAIKSDRFLFAAHARLVNRAELARAFAMAPPELAHSSDEALVLRAWQRWGADGIARCVGAFAFAIWDRDARRLILGRDCLGERALFFHRGRGFVAFATTLRGLLAMPDVPRAIDEITVANFLAVNLTEPRRTFYRGIERVPSRTLITIERSDIVHRYYWSPDPNAPPPFKRDVDYIERARELLDQAVDAVTCDTPHVAISTSGGLDSSAVAATAARLGRAERITCYSLVAPPDSRIDVGPHRYLDERDKVDALVHMYPALNAQFFTAETVHPYREDDTRYFARAYAPILGPSGLGGITHIYDAAAAAGHPALLIGSAGNFGLTWAGQFSLLALLRTNQFRTFADEFLAAARTGNRGLLRTLVGDIVTPAAPIPFRRLLHRLRGRDPDSIARFSALNAAFIAECDLTHQWRESGFDPWFGCDGRDPAAYRAHVLFDHNQIARDLHAMSEDARGFEIRDPLGDRRLLEFLLSVPEPVYRRNGVPRSFARAVLSDRLPREILDERRRGAHTIAWFKHLEALRPAIAVDLERLQASPSARRLLDLPRLKKLLDQWPKDAQDAENHRREYRSMLSRGIHVGRFIRWVEGGNA